ncbi:acyl-CoA synthetase (AMP-forming)/AMP-acid ligase II [Saccharothrix saharensis]|uniref:Acyl-CoA synthetase (AMP-forming)/AMP-acid ligase II n=1 Tax=Saccharothrix saharensis TaxID=571190 RepID=A0A543J542_9PSEU|nr:fatty acid--CoA ligase family protein [Saccharothrix saharensis]TQM77964.1 acyl-CoA synthetase (AMP-forming)/AMP-acid ligase II [Saccharothrix saharensis]
MSWTSSTGVVVRDLVPAALRRSWVAAGHCPDRDLYSLFRDRVAAHPVRTAVIDPDGAWDYASLDRAVRWQARALSRYGPTDIIGIAVPNGREAVVAELAVAAVGGVAVHLPDGGSPVVSTVVTDVSEAVAAASDPRRDVPWTPVAVGPEAPARILVSSGSEAAPKLVAYSHNAFAGGRGNYVRAVHGDTAVPRDLVLVPQASAFGSFGAAITLCRWGGTVVLMRRFDAVEALRAVAEHRPTHVFGVPTMLRRMAALASTADMSSVRAVVSSGDVLTPGTLAAVRSAFGCPVINVYGSSDGVNCHTATPEHGVGRPDPAVTDIRVVDGEICARGPMTPLCYVDAPELDRRHRLPGGWVRTGDEGRFDADGTLHVVRRLKRVVIRGGFTISPAEVERALDGHPVVAEAACVPVPDPDLGERLCACVAVRPGHRAPSLDQLTAFLRERGLSRRKLPEHLVVLPELPLGRTGKVCLPTVTRLAAEHHAAGRGEQSVENA